MVKFNTRRVCLSGTASDTVQVMHDVASEYASDPAVSGLLAAVPFAPRRDWFAQMMAEIRRRVRYANDARGVEQIKSPGRLLADGAGDCDDFATLWGCILRRVGLAFRFRIVKYRANGPWAHVYVVVPTPGSATTTALVLDQVEYDLSGQPLREVAHVAEQDFPRP